MLLDQSQVISGEQLQLLGLSRVGHKWSQMAVVGAQELGQQACVKGVRLRPTHTEPVSRSVHCFGIDWIKHHPVIQKVILPHSTAHSLAAQGCAIIQQNAFVESGR